MQKQIYNKSQEPHGIVVKQQQELMQFLIENFPQNSRSYIKSLLHNHRVKVNNRTISVFNHQLVPGDDVKIIKPTIKKTFNFQGINILFEDKHIIVIDKPEGLLSVSGQNKEEITAYRILSKYVKEKESSERIFVVHRLDRDTSGVMLYAKSQKVQESLQKNWEDIIKERMYIAVVEGYLENESGEIKSYLSEGKTFKVHSSFTNDNGQLALLSYRRIRQNPRFSMVEVSLQTGRKNQIRVQFQSMGHPVAGDKKYGANTNPFRRLALHAKTIVFQHPVSKEILNFIVKPPVVFNSVF